MFQDLASKIAKVEACDERFETQFVVLWGIPRAQMMMGAGDESFRRWWCVQCLEIYIMGLLVFCCSDHSAAENRRCQRKAIIEKRTTKPTISEARRAQVRPSSFDSNSLWCLPSPTVSTPLQYAAGFSKKLSML